VPDPDAALDTAIEAGRTVLVDTSVVLAYIGGREATSDLARQLFDGFAATGRNPTAVSAVTAAELLVRPFRRGSSAVATVEGFLRHFGDLRLVEVTYAVAREAARIRAATDLPMPDALIVASASVTDTDFLVTNDRAWSSRLRTLLPDLSILVLADLV
jgi:predicted nucleic acid-binding protein